MAPRGLFRFGNPVQPSPAADDALDVVRRPIATDGEQALFCLGRGDTGQRPDLRV